MIEKNAESPNAPLIRETTYAQAQSNGRTKKNIINTFECLFAHLLFY